MKVDNMHNYIARVQSANSIVCEHCGIVSHTKVNRHMPIEQTRYVNNYGQKPQNNPYSNSYNHEWRNHLNFSYKNNLAHNPPPQNAPRQPPHFSGTSTLEATLKNSQKRNSKLMHI